MLLGIFSLEVTRVRQNPCPAAKTRAICFGRIHAVTGHTVALIRRYPPVIGRDARYFGRRGKIPASQDASCTSLCGSLLRHGRIRPVQCGCRQASLVATRFQSGIAFAQ
jgi:hypothetical protein